MDPDPQPPGCILEGTHGLRDHISDMLASSLYPAQTSAAVSTPDAGTLFWLWGLLVILLLLSAFFSGSETSIFSLTKIHLARFAKQKKSSTILKLLDDPRTTLTTILFCNMLVNVAAALIGGAIAKLYFMNMSPLLSFLAGAVGVTILILVIAEITPKTLAIEKTEMFAHFASPFILFLSRIFYPVEKVIQLFTNSVFRIFRLSPIRETTILSEAELKALLTMGEVEGLLEEDEKEMIEGVFEFGGKTVEEIMTPRIGMICFPDSLSSPKMLKEVRNAPHKRLPVYHENLDNIVGILHSKDLLLNQDTHYRTLLRKPLLVPPKKNLNELMTEFKKERSHVAIVVDEFGGTAGLVTLHDLLEEIVGDIWEKGEEEPLKIVKLSGSEWLISGKTEIEEINELLELNLSEEMGRTLAGLIMNTIGKVPSQGDEIETDGVRIRVERMGKNTVARARVSNLHSGEETE